MPQKWGADWHNANYPLSSIISSPAKRALTTANIVAEQLQYPLSDIQQDAQIYEASVGDLMAVVQKFDDQLSCIMLVGHNPGLTSLSYYLTAYQVNNMPTCSLFCAEFDSERWENIHPASGQMTFFDYPKKIA
ncbi:SixA phosphatase family protein [Candidatus Venteria ishoeyi]|uniref:Phosphohistidine phosphatase n=1 Tax=Candidatus Venteria ishoeyi TaxID=1899563 RepID=A0A1H6F8Y0_9GAMM|nr:histidine phosphatase family protein [Candidatus Venteria ishoeyi]SEH06578.1 Uncharacterised protein [Candidatus Venteria ishoeyi]